MRQIMKALIAEIIQLTYKVLKNSFTPIAGTNHLCNKLINIISI
jgi:hypothetical protein